MLEDLGDDIEAYLLRADSSDPAMFYFSGFEAHDPVVYLRKTEEDILLVSPLEVTRARKESDVNRVVSTSEYREGDSRENVDAHIQIFKDFLQDEGVESIAVPNDFPLRLGDDLRESGFSLKAVEDISKKLRRSKTSEELQKVGEAQKTTEKAMQHAKKILQKASVKEGEIHSNGEVLTSEKLRSSIKDFLIENDCEIPEKTIVASGEQSSRPHDLGSGPLKAGEPIIIDIFPKKDRYFGDMTRTFFKGQPSNEARELYEAVLEAQEAAFEVLEEGEGLDLSEVHEEVCEVFEERGFDTLRSNPDTEEGFIHSTGHSVGLDLHEAPRVAKESVESEKNMVLTIEPGLYYEDIGGVRIEDMIVVKKDGFENLNSMAKRLEQNII